MARPLGVNANLKEAICFSQNNFRKGQEQTLQNLGSSLKFAEVDWPARQELLLVLPLQFRGLGHPTVSR